MAEEIVIDIDVDKGGQAGKSLKQLKQEFRDQQKELQNLTAGSKEYIAQLKRLGQIKDEIGDLNDEIKGLGSAQGSFRAIGNVASGIAGGFTAATGAAALFGQESAEVEKTLLKVQAALALSQGIEQLAGLADGFKVLGSIIRANPLFALASVVIAITTAFIGLEDIMNGIKIAFNAVGEAVSTAFDFIADGILFAIDLYTQYLDLLTFGLLDINGAYREYRENIEAANEADRERRRILEEQIDALNEVISATEAKIAADKAALELIKQQEKSVISRYDKEIALAKAAGKETFEIEQQKLAELIKITKIKLQLQQSIFDDEIEKANLIAERNRLETGSELGFFRAKAKEQEKINKEASKARLDDIRKLTDDIDKFELEIQTNAIKHQQELNEKYKEASLERIELSREEAKRIQEIADENQKVLLEIQKRASDEYLAFRKEKADEEVVINLDVLDQVLNATEEKALKDNEKVVEQLNFEKQAADQRVNLALGTINTLSAITDLFGKKNEANAKKAFEINKALNIASALVQTYQSATAAYASQLSIPTPDAPIRAAVAAGIAVAAGLANVAKIAQTKFESTSSAGGAPSISAPSVQGGGAPQTGGGNQFNSTLLDRERIESGQQNQRVYVLESDISQTQNRVNTIVSRATVQ